MNPEIQLPVPEPQPKEYTVPWKTNDNWVGVLILVLITIGLLAIIPLGWGQLLAQNIGIALFETIYILPVAVIFAWRGIHWKHLGFGKFDATTMGLGCGLLIFAYAIIIIHNSILIAFGIDTQGQDILNLFESLESPIWLVISAVILAPLVEEIFFRGFLFQGFRQRYGWVRSMLLSSTLFSIAHLDPTALVPTFILGCVLAYLYHRSNSVWPGVILHFLVNGFAMCSLYVATQIPGIIPS